MTVQEYFETAFPTVQDKVPGADRVDIESPIGDSCRETIDAAVVLAKKARVGLPNEALQLEFEPGNPFFVSTVESIAWCICAELCS